MSATNWSFRVIGIDDKAAWTTALAGIPHAIAHTHGYNQAMATASGLPSFLLVLESAAGRAVCPLAERRDARGFDVVSPYGYGGFIGTGNLTGAPQAWRRFAGERGYIAGYVALHPTLAAGAWRACATLSAPSFILNIAADEDHLMAGMTSRRRYDLRAWLRDDHPVEDRGALVEAFIRLHPRQAERVDAAPVYHFGEPALRLLLAIEETIVVGTRGRDGIEAVALFGLTPAAGEYLLAASTQTGRCHAKGLVWRGILALKKRGVGILNLGGGIRPGDGVAEFKRRFGAVETPGSCVKEIFDSARYGEACRAVGVDPASAGYFPAYRAAAAGRVSTSALATG